MTADGCRRDKAGNRTLHFDQYCLLVLLYLFNPICSSLRALPRVMAASVLKAPTGSGMVKWRLHSQFEVDRYVPSRIDVTRDGGGDNDERSAFERTVQANKLYVMDRGYAKFSLFNAVHAAKSSYVCRVRDNSVNEVLEEKPLTDADRAANVLSDQIVSLGQRAKKNDRPDHSIRLVIVKIKPHVSAGKYRGGTSGVDSDGFLRIATDLLDVPAEIIALLYHYRWTIEIFFRTFKHLLGCRHLLSHNQNGIEIQTYCAIIACLLISLWTGRKPTKRTCEMICYHLKGWADEATLTAHITKLQQPTPRNNADLVFEDHCANHVRAAVRCALADALQPLTLHTHPDNWKPPVTSVPITPDQSSCRTALGLAPFCFRQ